MYSLGICFFHWFYSLHSQRKLYNIGCMQMLTNLRLNGVSMNQSTGTAKFSSEMDTPAFGKWLVTLSLTVTELPSPAVTLNSTLPTQPRATAQPGRGGQDAAKSPLSPKPQTHRGKYAAIVALGSHHARLSETDKRVSWGEVTSADISPSHLWMVAATLSLQCHFIGVSMHDDYENWLKSTQGPYSHAHI